MNEPEPPPSLLILGARPRGRPKVEEPLSAVSTRLPPRYHDRIIQLAKQQDTSVAAIVRHLLMLKLR